MNINQAKTEIKNAVKAYFTKDENGEYVLPIQQQRPIFLMGPPGIGKTAIMEQIAQELNIGLLSYSMTHHTRQSALGLPFISHKVYDGQEYDISEYTMSEIIASVYDLKQESGITEGILFLDEINCVSETLAPIMLQFLQYKVFGRHKVPDGFIVVTAGNPPEYNNSVREFDIVTWDRLKRIDVEEDFEVWNKYALNKGIHPAIRTYLEINKGDFYLVESTVGGKEFVTARGWEDLSAMIQLYEKNNIAVSENLVSQYLQQGKISKKFAIYYDLFKKYQSDYQVLDILNGKAEQSIIARASSAKFDERIALVGLLLDACFRMIDQFSYESEARSMMVRAVPSFMSNANSKNHNFIKDKIIDRIYLEKNSMLQKQKANSLSLLQKQSTTKFIKILQDLSVKFNEQENAVDVLKNTIKSLKANETQNVKNTTSQLNNVFSFIEQAFGDGHELQALLTEFTLHSAFVDFINTYGCEKYFQYNKNMLISQRRTNLLSQADEILKEELE